MKKTFYISTSAFILGVILFFIFRKYLPNVEIYVPIPIMAVSIILMSNFFPYSENKYVKLGVAAALTLVFELITLISTAWPTEGIDLYFGILIFLAPISYSIIFIFDTRSSFDIALKLLLFMITLPILPLSIPMVFRSVSTQIAVVTVFFVLEVILDLVIIGLAHIKNKEYDFE